MPVGPGARSVLSHGRGPRRRPVGVRPPTSRSGQLRWALGPGAQEPSDPLPTQSLSEFCLIGATGHSPVVTSSFS